MPNTAADALHVAVGVILRDDGQILLARRAAHQHQGELWEFPGGKVDADETVQQALCRELQEELGIEVVTAALEPLLDVHHQYPDRSVWLDVWWVREFHGLAQGREGQPLVWVPAETLHRWPLPAANAAIVQAIQQAFGLCSDSTNL